MQCIEDCALSLLEPVDILQAVSRDCVGYGVLNLLDVSVLHDFLIQATATTQHGTTQVRALWRFIHVLN